MPPRARTAASLKSPLGMARCYRGISATSGGPDFPANQFSQLPAGKEQPLKHAFVQMPVGGSDRPAAPAPDSDWLMLDNEGAIRRLCCVDLIKVKRGTHLLNDSKSDT